MQNTTVGQDIDNLALIKKKTAKWGDAELMQMVIQMETNLMEYSLAKDNKKKQTSIKDFFTSKV